MGTPSVEQLTEAVTGFDRLYGLELLSVSDTEVTARVAVREELKQPAGLVHGGVYASIAESIASLATHVAVAGQGEMAMGLSNSTSFLRPVTEGTVHASRRADAPRPHDMGLGRALQRRPRPHLRGHAHDDRGARRAGASARASRAGAPCSGSCEGRGVEPKPVSGSRGGSAWPGLSGRLIATIARAAAERAVAASLAKMLTTTPPVGIAIVRPALVSRAGTPRTSEGSLSVSPPGRKLLSGEVTIRSGGMQVPCPPCRQLPYWTLKAPGGRGWLR